MKELMKQVPPLLRPVIDYPKQDETVVGWEYTIRVSAPEDAASVDIAIDQGDWQACRYAVGFWWFDWSAFGKGEHEVVARMLGADGKPATSRPTEFFVDIA
jgi:hypothetical protein